MRRRIQAGPRTQASQRPFSPQHCLHQQCGRNNWLSFHMLLSIKCIWCSLFTNHDPKRREIATGFLSPYFYSFRTLKVYFRKILHQCFTSSATWEKTELASSSGLYLLPIKHSEQSIPTHQITYYFILNMPYSLKPLEEIRKWSIVRNIHSVFRFIATSIFNTEIPGEMQDDLK